MTEVGSDAIVIVRRVRRRTARRVRLVTGVLAALVVAAFVARTLLGDYLVTVPDFVRVLSGETLPGTSFVLMDSKLPRAVVGTISGAAFGLGGAIFQAVLRNPLASPDVVGISAGASAAAVIGIVVFGVSDGWLALWAVVGALAVAAGIVAAAGPRSGTRFVLVGVASSTALIGVVQYLFARASIFDAQKALVWLTGSLNQVDWPTIARLAVAVAVLMVTTAALAPRLRAAELGEDASAALGVPSRRVLPLLLVGVLLTAVATAATGPIAFVALLAGPLGRALNRGRVTLLGAALTGGLVVVVSDYIAAYGIPDTNLPVGVVTGAVGAVVLIWLLVGQQRRAS